MHYSRRGLCWNPLSHAGRTPAIFLCNTLWGHYLLLDWFLTALKQARIADVLSWRCGGGRKGPWSFTRTPYFYYCILMKEIVNYFFSFNHTSCTALQELLMWKQKDVFCSTLHLHLPKYVKALVGFWTHLQWKFLGAAGSGRTLPLCTKRNSGRQ